MNARQIPATVLLTRADVAQVKHAGLANWAVTMAQEVDRAIVSGCWIQSKTLFDMASIRAASALGAPLGRLEVKEAVGRVLWIACERVSIQHDPVIPLVLIPMGRRYEQAYCQYVRHVARYYAYAAGGGWWARAYELCGGVLAALSKVADRLTRVELAYLVLKLQIPLAWPVGVKE